MLECPWERQPGILHSARSLLKTVRMGKKWNSLGLYKPKRGDGDMDQMERAQRTMLPGPKHRFFWYRSPLATGQARPQSQWGRGAGTLIILTPVQSLNAANQAGQEVSTSFQWNLVVLRFPSASSETWWFYGFHLSSGKAWRPKPCMLVQAFDHKCSSLWVSSETKSKPN